jgi:hypothetical protein
MTNTYPKNIQNLIRKLEIQITSTKKKADEEIITSKRLIGPELPPVRQTSGPRR